MKRIEQKVLKFSDEKELIKGKDRILIALSGGPDSVFLLYVLHKYKKRFNIEIGAFHLNHKLRGKAADKDEQFCNEFCGKLGVEYFSKSRDVKSYSKKNKISVEEAGREIRYYELEKIAKKNNFNKIATAHNLDDNAETVLLNLIKGAGLKGLSGIPTFRGKIIRPVLSVSKNEIVEYLKTNRIDYRIDESNISSDYERNFLRNEVINLIKDRLNPSLNETLLKSSEVFGEYFKLVSSFVEKYSEDLFDFTGETLKLNLSKIATIEVELLSILVKENIDKYFSVQTNFDDSKKVLSLLNKQSGKKVDLSLNLSAIKERDEILIFKKKKENDFRETKISAGEEIKLNGKILSINLLNNLPQNSSSNPDNEFISAKGLSEIFNLRRWKNGDRFYPLGMKGSKKVSDFLNEQKVSSMDKKNQLVLLNKNNIVWVVGLRIDERVKVTDKNNKVYNLCLK